MVTTRFITETRLPKNRKAYYICEADDAGNVISKQIYTSCVKKVTTDAGVDYMLIDNEGRVRVEPTQYLQDLRTNLPPSTHKTMAVAINTLYTFCDIFNKDPRAMKGSDVEEFMQFALGYKTKNKGRDKVTYLSPRTVNMYLGYIRRYIDAMGFDLKGFTQNSVRNIQIPKPRLTETDGTYSAHKKVFRAERTDPKKNRAVPKHIKPKEMQDMVVEMKKSGDTRSLCMCVLQYGYGLRVGEALGLTLEDIKKEEREGRTYCYILLRNRVSDKIFQYCKGLYHPKGRDEYTVSHWQDSFWEIPIAERHYDLLMTYYRVSRDPARIRAAHPKTSKKVIETIKRETWADAVDGDGDANYYIFIADNGQCLSCQTWNNILKRYFIKVGVKPDTGKRYRNASHRLRHGFAMWNARYCAHPLSILELAKIMRHANPQSTAIYYSLTEEDELEIRIAHTNELHNLIPEI